ncbi:MAG: LysR substrate-binding domain-containing protein [Pseudomonadota bacterium]
MATPTLRQLRYFAALARHCHFGHAAEACGVSQPALSLQIKELEDIMGAPLVDRSARQVAVTPLGQSLVDPIDDILHAVDELSDMARASQDRLVGKLRIGVIPTVAPYLLPTTIAAIAAKYPGLHLHVRETLTPKLIDELAQGRLDAAIMALPVSESQFAETPLFNEDFVLIRPDSQADEPVPDPQHLREMRLLLLEEGHCFRDQALALCSIQPALTSDSLDASSLTTLVQLVGAGVGVTLLPEMAIKVETQAAPVAAARFPNPAPHRTIGMVWRKANPLAPRLKEIATLITPPPSG